MGMKYQILYIIDNTKIKIFETGKIHVITAKYHTAINSVGSLTFKLSPLHEAYNSIETLKGIVVLLKNDKIIFKSRVYSITIDDYNIKTVECEGLLAVLNDSVVKPYVYSEYESLDGTKSTQKFGNWIYQLTNNHNKQVTENAHFFSVDMSSELQNLNFSCKNTNYSDTWSELKSKFINEINGYLWVEYKSDLLSLSTEDDVLHFDTNLSRTCNQEIKYAVNLSSIERKICVDDFATAILPVGGEYENENGDKVKTSIASVNDNNDFLIDEEAIKIYGRINKVVNFDGVLSPAELFKLAKAKLNEFLALSGSLSVKAVDLSIINETLDSFDIGQKIKIISENHQTDMFATISEYEIDLTQPQSAEYKLNSDFKSFVNQTNQKIYKIGE